MIILDDTKEYFILIDGQGGTFGGGRICEGKTEVFEQFEDWADSDEIDITDYTMSDLIEVWNIDIKKYNGADFVELSATELNQKK
jgi:hypothetical protein